MREFARREAVMNLSQQVWFAYGEVVTELKRSKIKRADVVKFHTKQSVLNAKRTC